jgi:hypothetical protein
MPKFYLPSRRPPANGVTPRSVPSQMAPERCIGYEWGVTNHTIIITGSDLKGQPRIRVELAQDDLSPWLVKVIRHWLAWYSGASEIKIVG